MSILNYVITKWSRIAQEDNPYLTEALHDNLIRLFHLRCRLSASICIVNDPKEFRRKSGMSRKN